MKDHELPGEDSPSLALSAHASQPIPPIPLGVPPPKGAAKTPRSRTEKPSEGSSVLPKGAVPAPLPPREEERIARLLGYEILDTAKDQALDRLTRMAALICEVPIALISLVDRNRQWFKSAYGLSFAESCRDESICSYTILDPDRIFIVPDTTKDPRFATNPLVTGEPYIRFYAGVPIVDTDKLALGSFCVIDRMPKQLSEQQLTLLRMISEAAMDLIELHKHRIKLTRLLHLEKEVYSKLLLSSADLVTIASTFDDALSFLMSHLDPNLGWLSARIRNMQTGGTTGISYNASLPDDPELPLLWQRIDGMPRHTAEIATRTEFIKSSPHGQEYSYMVVPVRLKERLVAIIELIYPDHRNLDARIGEVFELLASNLSIIAERELVLLELRHQVSHDSLTGAANRNVIMTAVESAIRDCDPLKPDSAVFFFDIDGFKDVNDNFGHETGDRLLKEISKRLEGVCRNKDVLGRLSGDEFVLLARQIDIESGLAPVLERIQRTLSQSFMLGELEIKVNSSIGCAVIDDPGITPNELLRRAEEAMYLVKNGFTKGFCIADEEVVRKFQIRRSIDHKVKDAVENNRFFVAFQPIINLQTGENAGLETLLRILEKDGTEMEAREFIHAIERTRFMARVDEMVMAEAFKNFASGLPKELLQGKGFWFSVNVSPPILATKGYAANCLRQLESAGIAPSSLMLEIIESDLVALNETVIRNLTELREKGVRIALDDFGTGYSNLHNLASLPVDIIKIDKAFIRGSTSGDLARSGLLNAIVGIGKNLGYEIVAEGIEGEGEANYVKALGCQYAQGYFFGKPMPMEQILERFSMHPSRTTEDHPV
jgi:diguanylate cyclase (GGDEF)-like protein